MREDQEETDPYWNGELAQTGMTNIGEVLQPSAIRPFV